MHHTATITATTAATPPTAAPMAAAGELDDGAGAALVLCGAVVDLAAVLPVGVVDAVVVLVSAGKTVVVVVSFDNGVVVVGVVLVMAAVR